MGLSEWFDQSFPGTSEEKIYQRWKKKWDFECGGHYIYLFFLNYIETVNNYGKINLKNFFFSFRFFLKLIQSFYKIEIFLKQLLFGICSVSKKLKKIVFFLYKTQNFNFKSLD